MTEPELVVDDQLEFGAHSPALTGFLDPTSKPPITANLLNRAFGVVSSGARSKVWFRGGWTCTCVAESLPWVEYDMIRKGLIKQSIDIYQLGYNGGGVAASAGTHDGGGNTDVNQYSAAQIAVWRDWGWAMQHRSRAQGFDADHGHGWPIGCTHMSAGGNHQAWQWRNRTNGLASYGPIQGPYTTENWRDALERNFYKMFTLNDIEDRMVKAVITALKKDGVLNNINTHGSLTNNPKNPTIAVTTTLEAIGKRVMALQKSNEARRDEIAEIRKGLAEVKALLVQLVPPVPPTTTAKVK